MGEVVEVAVLVVANLVISDGDEAAPTDSGTDTAGSRYSVIIINPSWMATLHYCTLLWRTARCRNKPALDWNEKTLLLSGLLGSQYEGRTGSGSGRAKAQEGIKKSGQATRAVNPES